MFDQTQISRINLIWSKLASLHKSAWILQDTLSISYWVFIHICQEEMAVSSFVLFFSTVTGFRISTGFKTETLMRLFFFFSKKEI